jgi:hypothetical protein
MLFNPLISILFIGFAILTIRHLSWFYLLVSPLSPSAFVLSPSLSISICLCLPPCLTTISNGLVSLFFLLLSTLSSSVSVLSPNISNWLYSVSWSLDYLHLPLFYLPVSLLSLTVSGFTACLQVNGLA